MLLSSADWLVLSGYFAVLVLVAWWYGREERSTHDYFLGGRRQPWLVVGLSIIATELSALTFVGVPAEAFNGDWTYLQMYAGSFLGRVLIALLLLPSFYGGAVTTVYEYLGQRFGPWTRTTGSILFFASRIIGSGFRLLAASLALSAVFNWDLTWVIIGATAVAVLYTTFGGIKAIIWTDAFQAVVFLAGALAVIVFLFHRVPGAWDQNLSTAYEAGKLHVFTWRGGLNNDKLFWVLLVHATVQNMAALGTDQDLTQRMLTCPDVRRGQRSLMFNAFAGLPIVCLFLLVGTMLFLFYESFPQMAPDEETLGHKYRIFPHFIATVLPAGSGLRGLLLAGLFAASMSSLDSALGALSSTAVTDFYRPLMRRPISERHALMVARVLVVLFGVLLAGVALCFAGDRSLELLWEAFKWTSPVFGAMLGVFLLGVLTRHRGRDGLNVVAMVTSIAFLVGLRLYQERTGNLLIAWPWWVVVGMLWTFVLGVCTGDPRRGRSPGGGRSGQEARRRADWRS
jgi:SSS family solute:Na+ symporter